jgi:hypothetical protein
MLTRTGRLKSGAVSRFEVVRPWRTEIFALPGRQVSLYRDQRSNWGLVVHAFGNSFFAYTDAAVAGRPTRVDSLMNPIFAK